MDDMGKMLLETYDPKNDPNGEEFRRLATSALLSLLDSDHESRLNFLTRFMYIMTGAWFVVAALVSAGYFLK